MEDNLIFLWYFIPPSFTRLTLLANLEFNNCKEQIFKIRQAIEHKRGKPGEDNDSSIFVTAVNLFFRTEVFHFLSYPLLCQFKV